MKSVCISHDRFATDLTGLLQEITDLCIKRSVFIKTIASYDTKMHFTPLSVESEIFLRYSRNKDIYRF